ncbi:hypothetical protein BGW80DRAFT_1290616 [Lactifluus volemus]|nr:hypothetical protein BGW80DRAFT_1290616 [Lactifluus volemus]
MYSKSMKGSFTAKTSTRPSRRALRSTMRPIRPKLPATKIEIGRWLSITLKDRDQRSLTR